MRRDFYIFILHGSLEEQLVCLNDKFPWDMQTEKINILLTIKESDVGNGF